MATDYGGVWGVTMVKDEADVIEHTIKRMLREVDGIVVADNGSTDGTLEILKAIGGEVTVLEDDEVGYYQSRKMTALARYVGHRHNAEWVIPFDADEVWFAHAGPIRDVLAGVEDDVAVIAAPVFNHYATALDDESDGNPLSRLQWREPGQLSLPKCMCRAKLRPTIAQGNHTIHFPTRVQTDLVEVRHFPYRSPDQFVSKAVNGERAYAATDLDRSVGQHWREYGENIRDNGREAGEAWFREYFFYERPADKLVHDPAP